MTHEGEGGSNALPHHDPKPQGAADFYLAINATFAHLLDRFGEEALRSYWRDLGRDYQRPVWQRWGAGGLPAVASYQEAFFAHEPDAEVEITTTRDRVELRVLRCPAIAHLRANDRAIVDTFCHHCAVMGDAAAQQVDLAVRVRGGNGACTQVFTTAAEAEPQDWAAIARCGGS